VVDIAANSYCSCRYTSPDDLRRQLFLRRYLKHRFCDYALTGQLHLCCHY
jgi:hypothetical protein